MAQTTVDMRGHSGLDEEWRRPSCVNQRCLMPSLNIAWARGLEKQLGTATQLGDTHHHASVGTFQMAGNHPAGFEIIPYEAGRGSDQEKGLILEDKAKRIRKSVA